MKLTISFLCLTLIGITSAAEPTSAPSQVPAGIHTTSKEWAIGTIVRIEKESITVKHKTWVPSVPVSREESFFIDKLPCDVLFGWTWGDHFDVKDGTRISEYSRIKRGSRADLRVGQAVEVKGKDGIASKILIVWPVTGTSGKVAEGSFIFKPKPSDDVPRESRRWPSAKKLGCLSESSRTSTQLKPERLSKPLRSGAARLPIWKK